MQINLTVVAYYHGHLQLQSQVQVTQSVDS